MRENVLKTIAELKEKSKKRNFSQTIDLIVILKEFDTKKSENKFTEDVLLPKGRGKPANVVVFSDTVKDLDCEIINSSELEGLGKNKREAKRLAASTQFFLAEAPMMPLIGKSLGQFLAPRGKMPKIVAGNIAPLVKTLKNSVRIKVKDSPVIQCLVGKEDMKDEDIEVNIDAVLHFLETKLPKGKHNIGEVLLKFTMSGPVKMVYEK
jgi:large subunit ribosomal protein L1